MFALANGTEGWDHMWQMGDGWGWWMVFGTVMMGVFWVALIWGIGTMLRRPPERDENARHRSGATALEILERRYASGELSDEEFEARRRRLVEGSSQPR